jgi:hypothetical protein
LMLSARSSMGSCVRRGKADQIRAHRFQICERGRREISMVSPSITDACPISSSANAAPLMASKTALRKARTPDTIPCHGLAPSAGFFCEITHLAFSMTLSFRRKSGIACTSANCSHVSSVSNGPGSSSITNRSWLSLNALCCRPLRPHPDPSSWVSFHHVALLTCGFS